MRRYGQWAGETKGIPEDPERCVASVTRGAGYLFRQCSRKRGKGPRGEYCAQHARMVDRGDFVYVPVEVPE